jgi:hypothetical protein
MARRFSKVLDGAEESSGRLCVCVCALKDQGPK